MKNRNFVFLLLIFSIFFEANGQSFILRRGNSGQTSMVEQKPAEEKAETSETAGKVEEKTEASSNGKLVQTEGKTAETEASKDKAVESEEKSPAEEREISENSSKPAVTREKIPFEKNLFVTFGPMLMVNTDSTARSAPSPVMYAGGIGGEFFAKHPLTAQTRLSFFTNYYLWDGEMAQPAEVENRTAIALSFLVDLCGQYNWFSGKNQFSLGAGVGILARFGLLCDGVEATDKNPLTGSEAGDDVGDINGDFFSGMNFLYPEITFAYTREISPKWKAGVEIRGYVPLGSLVNGNGIDGMLASLALKLVH